MKTAEELWDEYGGEPRAVFIEAIRDETRKECWRKADLWLPPWERLLNCRINMEHAILNAGKEKP